MYTNQADVEARLGTKMTDEQAAYFESLSLSTDAYIERVTGTKFGSTEIVDVYVDGEAGPMLIIPTMHDITAVTRIAEDGAETVLSVSDYRVYPMGAANTYAIRRINGEWEDGPDRYKITGVLGYKEVPADIAMVASELASGSIKADSNQYKSEKVGDWSVTYSDSTSVSTDAMTTLNGYKRLSRSI